MLFSRYGAMSDYVLDMLWADAVDLLNQAYKDKANDQMFMRWVINYEHEMSFKDFKDLLIKDNDIVDRKEVKDILTGLITVFG